MQFFLGGSAKFSKESESVYNDGMFHTVIASRDGSNGIFIHYMMCCYWLPCIALCTILYIKPFKCDCIIGTLSIDGSEIVPTEEVKSNMKDLDVKTANHYVGGVPDSFDTNQ